MNRFTQYLTASIAVMLAALTMLGGPPAAAGAVVARGPIAIPAAPATVTFASEGDSISALADNNGVTIRWSWVRNAVADGGLRYVGVYMRAGAMTAELLRNAHPTAARVMVVMAGTNDVAAHVPTSSTLNNIAAIFDRTGGQVKILSAVAPRNALPAQTLALNHWLAALAKQHGYVFIDPWVSVREPNGTWKPGANADPTHPSPATGQMVGSIMNSEIRAAVDGYAG